ncbi:hypothetical protein [Streptomyces sp. NPDC002573]
MNTYPGAAVPFGMVRGMRSLALTVGTEPSDWGTAAQAGPPALH